MPWKLKWEKRMSNVKCPRRSEILSSFRTLMRPGKFYYVKAGHQGRFAMCGDSNCECPHGEAGRLSKIPRPCGARWVASGERIETLDEMDGRSMQKVRVVSSGEILRIDVPTWRRVLRVRPVPSVS